MDPGSTDGSREIIEEYRNRIDHIIFEQDEGPADGLNKGFAKASGKIYGYLNSDDVLYQGTLKKVNKMFSSNKGIDVVSAHGHYIDDNGKLVRKIFSHQFNLSQYLYGNCVLLQQSTFFKSSIFTATKGFNKKNKIAWDGELMVDLFNAGANFKIVHEYWSGFRFYNQSISGGHDYKEKLNIDYYRLRKKYGFPDICFIRKKLLWLLNWIRQPILLFLRINLFMHQLIEKGFNENSSCNK